MKAFKLFLYLLIAIILIPSCSSTYRARMIDRDPMKFLNYSHQDLIEELGAPVREMSNGNEGYILVFSGQNVFNYQTNKFGGSLPELQCYMDNNGYCYDVVTTNTQARATSAGKTILLVVLIGCLVGLL